MDTNKAYNNLSSNAKRVLQALYDGEAHTPEGMTVADLCQYGVDHKRDVREAVEELEAEGFVQAAGSGAKRRHRITDLGCSLFGS